MPHGEIGLWEASIAILMNNNFYLLIEFIYKDKESLNELVT